jgi:ferredoxin--NADP+ reductase
LRRRIHFAIAGSGPSAFYAAEAILGSGREVQVDMFERLPAPFGLVRYGVAPDHPKTKSVTAVFEAIARDPRFAFHGNVAIGDRVAVRDLLACYDAVILATGASADVRLGIQGENLPGSHTAGEFVRWYNGDPDFASRRFDLSARSAVIVGQGNVALDVARILLRPVEELARTDIAEHALRELRRSRVREVHIVGRRGPAQAKFSTPELREITRMAGTCAVVAPADVQLNRESQEEIAAPSGDALARNLRVLRECAAVPNGDGKTLRFRFFESPCAIVGTGRVEALVLARTRLEGSPHRQIAVSTGEEVEVPCGIVFQSVGNASEPIAGVPVDPARGTVAHAAGRAWRNGRAVPGLYVTGWLKRGATGTIGTNRADSIETVASAWADLDASAGRADVRGAAGLRPLLETARVVGFADWQAIDRHERAAGAALGKPREKMTSVSAMLAACAPGSSEPHR